MRHMTEEEDKFISRCTPICFVVLSSSLVCVHFSLTYVIHYLSQAQGRFFWWQRFKGKENHQKGTEIRHCVTKGNARNNDRYCLSAELFMLLILFYNFIFMTLKCFHTNILLIYFYDHVWTFWFPAGVIFHLDLGFFLQIKSLTVRYLWYNFHK